jgi:hypothetical protein
MKHPQSRGERRLVRETCISRRKFIYEKVWRNNKIPHEGSSQYKQQEGWYREPAWGRYAKFNLNCGCIMCHHEKWFECTKRRRAMDQEVVDNVKSWE